jgi:hypothetical protein
MTMNLIQDWRTDLMWFDHFSTINYHLSNHFYCCSTAYLANIERVNHIGLFSIGTQLRSPARSAISPNTRNNEPNFNQYSLFTCDTCCEQRHPFRSDELMKLRVLQVTCKGADAALSHWSHRTRIQSTNRASAIRERTSVLYKGHFAHLLCVWQRSVYLFGLLFDLDMAASAASFFHPSLFIWPNFCERSLNLDHIPRNGGNTNRRECPREEILRWFIKVDVAHLYSLSNINWPSELFRSQWYLWPLQDDNSRWYTL